MTTLEQAAKAADEEAKKYSLYTSGMWAEWFLRYLAEHPSEGMVRAFDRAWHSVPDESAALATSQGIRAALMAIVEGK